MGPDSTTPWPAVERREVAWRTDPDQYGADGRRPNREDRLLTSVITEVPAEIAALPLHLSADVAEACRAVESDISRLDERYGSTLIGLTSFLVRSESVASSRIEHVYADLDDVARASIAQEASRSARDTVAAAAAVAALIDSQAPHEPFTEQQLLRAHKTLLEDDPLEKAYAGRYRDMQNWLGGSDFSPRDAVHVPPPPNEVQPLMRDLVAFVNREDVSPLAQAAVAHGHFEAIHPFTDGNGRIGRGLIAVVLRRRAVARQVVVPVASVMLADIDSYFESLIAYRHGDAETLVRYLANAAQTATVEASTSASRLAEMPMQWRERAKPRARSSADLLIERLVGTPVLDAKRAQQLTGSAMPRTYDALEKLHAAGVLREITGGAKNRIWVASDVITELVDLDARIGRRATPSPRWRGRP